MTENPQQNRILGSICECKFTFMLAAKTKKYARFDHICTDWAPKMNIGAVNFNFDKIINFQQ